jgi:hypothetical protein
MKHGGIKLRAYRLFHRVRLHDETIDRKVSYGPLKHETSSSVIVIRDKRTDKRWSR